MSSARRRAAAAPCCARCSPTPGSPGGPPSTSRSCASAAGPTSRASTSPTSRTAPCWTSSPVSGPPRPHPGAIEERLAALIAHATTPNGVFGTKVMWSYMADLQERLAELPGFGRLQDAERLSGLLGDVRYAHLAEDPGRVLQETLDFISVGDRAHAGPPPPSMRRQSGAQSREWADRYRREEEAHQ